MKTIFFASLFLLLPIVSNAQTAVAPTTPALPTHSPAVILSLLVMVAGQLLKSQPFGEWLKKLEPYKRTFVMTAVGLFIGAAGAYLEGARTFDVIATKAWDVALGGIFLHEVVVAGVMKLKTGVVEAPAEVVSPPAIDPDLKAKLAAFEAKLDSITNIPKVS